MAFFSNTVNQDTLRALSSEITDALAGGESIGQISNRLSDLFDFSEKFRSTRIARTEIIGSANEGQLEAYTENGVKDKEWVTARDEKVRDSHKIDGQNVGITDDFTLASGVKIQHPGDRKGNAPVGEIVNCRCTVNPVIKGD